MVVTVSSPNNRSWYLNWLNISVRLVKFVVLAFIALIIYGILLDTIFTRKIHIFTYILFWLFTAYIVLPRLNRWLTKLYVPDYFIGRARTGDGLLGDPVNLALDGSEEQIIACMRKAGWTPAEKLTLKASIKMIVASVFGRSYPNAPVSSLYLFGSKQDLAFQREINRNPRKRHHVRFWKTPEGWYLPGGNRTDWLGAATYDKHVGLSLFTGQITHKINADVDKERDFVVDTMQASGLVKSTKIVEHFTTSYHARNGGGDRIHTDGALPFMTLKDTAS